MKDGELGETLASVLAKVLTEAFPPRHLTMIETGVGRSICGVEGGQASPLLAACTCDACLVMLDLLQRLGLACVEMHGPVAVVECRRSVPHAPPGDYRVCNHCFLAFPPEAEMVLGFGEEGNELLCWPCEQRDQRSDIIFSYPSVHGTSAGS